ncbi:hypothetical protein MUK42_08177 [Musa troglodytarum]|uniref:Uncharacterized protein n=1 Tax=Musa troglodytarum TaxID=320322 RepID=A0A9E7EI10_9LILI|nr:hypothetical protein MUK42_08177 [Musa troglodytarum]
MYCSLSTSTQKHYLLLDEWKSSDATFPGFHVMVMCRVGVQGRHQNAAPFTPPFAFGGLSLRSFLWMVP